MNVKFPHINTIRFYQVGKGSEWTNTIKFWEYRTNYFQKFRETDMLCFQLLLDDAPLSYIKYEVVNVETGVVEYTAPTAVVVPIHYLPAYDGYIAYQYNAPILGYAMWTENKLVQIQLTIETNSGNIYLKSDYLMVYYSAYSDKMIDNTVVITAEHDQNDYEFVFDNSELGFNTAVGKLMMRVEGGFASDGFTPSGKFTLYQDQRYKPVMLNAVPFNIQKFTLGSNLGVPSWVADKLNRLLSLSTFEIDGVQWCRSEGAKLEPLNRDHFYPSCAWQIDLMLSDNPYSDSATFIEGATLTPFTADTTLVSADDEEVTIDQDFI